MLVSNFTCLAATANLIIAAKTNRKEIVYAGHILRKHYFKESCAASGAKVAPHTQVRKSAMLLLLIAGNWDALQRRNLHIKCRDTLSLGFKLEIRNTQTHNADSMVMYCLPFFVFR
jgi:hypothetical protein